MLFISVDDFYQKTKGLPKLSRDAEKLCAIRKDQGDTEARKQIINSYLPMVASCIRRYPQHTQTLGVIYNCVRTLEKAVDRFNFQQDSETFVHYLSWRLRQCIVRSIVSRI